LRIFAMHCVPDRPELIDIVKACESKRIVKFVSMPKPTYSKTTVYWDLQRYKIK